MKSKENALLRVVEGVFEDILLAHPTSGGLMRDLSRLTTCVADRGLRVFTLDLPALDERLLASLEAKHLVKFAGFLSKRRGPFDVRPRFLWDLWSRIFYADGGLKEDADPNAILFLRQVSCLGKKLAVECDPRRTEEARRDYHSIESEARRPTLHWEDDDLGDFARCHFADDIVINDSAQLSLFPEQRDFTLFRELDFVCSVLTAELGLFYEPTLDRFNHGPGAVADAGGRNYKFDFPTWPAKLDFYFPYDWCGSHTIDTRRRPSLSEPPSRLIAVPKTAKGPRLIAAEPTSHQWAQQWIKNEIVDRLPAVRLGKFINILDQVPSQEMVRRASLDRSLATLDLSSASDRVTCWHIERLLGANESLLRLSHAVRTRWVRDSIGTTTEFLKLRKFAAMGSALTFPIQSIFFACLAITACGARSTRDIDALVGKVRVFGDDIIVPESGYAPLVDLLHRLGLKVNVQKSFCTGHFRESCGLDAFKGYDVTPVKAKRLWVDCPEDFAAVVDTSNNLFLKGFWRAARRVQQLAKWKQFVPISVPVASGLLGLQSFTGFGVDRVTRYNRDLQRYEMKVLRLAAKVPLSEPSTSSGLLDFFTQARRMAGPREEAGFAWNDFQAYSGRRGRPSVVLRTAWEGPILP